MKKRRLLIVSCSMRKNDAKGSIAAWDLYDGPIYRLLKKAQREATMPKSLDVLILSAKYGLIHPDEKIKPYDQKMTTDSALQMRAKVAKRLKQTMKRYESVALCMSKLYLSALGPCDAWLPYETDVTTIGGTIGWKQRGLKQLLSKLA